MALLIVKPPTVYVKSATPGQSLSGTVTKNSVPVKRLVQIFRDRACSFFIGETLSSAVDGSWSYTVEGAAAGDKFSVLVRAESGDENTMVYTSVTV